MERIFTALPYRRFPAGWYFVFLVLLSLSAAGLQAQGLPVINTVNGLAPACATEEQALALTINGSNFTPQAQVRIRGTAFAGQFLITPAPTPSATLIQIALPANSPVLADAGTLTIDVQQADAEGDAVFSNAVQLPVYPKPGPSAVLRWFVAPPRTIIPFPG